VRQRALHNKNCFLKKRYPLGGHVRKGTRKKNGAAGVWRGRGGPRRGEKKLGEASSKEDQSEKKIR